MQQRCIDRLPDALLTDLWARLAAMFGAGRLEREFGATPPDIWGRGLAGLTGIDLARGLRRLVDSGAKWPPSLSEFRELCLPRPEDLGLPSESAAYLAACEANWRLHPAVWHAARSVGVYSLRHDPEARTRPAFARAWAAVMEQVRVGTTFELPQEDVPQLPDLRSRQDRLIAARRHMASILVVLRGAA